MSLFFNHGYWSNSSKPGGQVFFVSGGTVAYRGKGGSDSSDGLTPERPLSTISGALSKCVSGRGDTIVILPGTITLTAAVNITIADLTIQGYADTGPHVRKPSIITAAATYDDNLIQIDADDVTIKDLTFEAGFTNTTANQEVIQINSTDASSDIFGAVIENCFFEMNRAAGAASVTDNDLDVIRVGLDSNDRAFSSTVRGCTIRGCDQDAISISSGSTGALIENNQIYDGVGSELTRIGVSILAIGACVKNNFIMTGTSSDTAGPISVGAAAALARIHDNRLVARGEHTVGITVVTTATACSSANWINAVSAGNIVDYKGSSVTTPSSSADVGNIFNASDPALAAFTAATLAGS